MISRIKQIIYYPYAWFKIRHKYRKLEASLPQTTRLYLLNIPSHGNLGDHLLSVAEHQFFKDNLPNIQVVSVTSSDLYYSIKQSLASVRENDILCITGGGFLGSLYDEEERFFSILRMFPQNKIIVLPQTIFYEQSIKGQKALKRAKAFYQSHKKLYVVARDQKSFDLLNSYLMKGRKENVAFTPDLALYMKMPLKLERDGILWCLRKDAEISDSNNDIIRELTRQVQSIGVNEVYTDTYVPYSIPFELERQEVHKKIEQFSQAKLVITDRLHGMIYSVITGTPVIALDNISGKVSQVYKQWLNSLRYVKFVSSVDESKDLIQKMISLDDYIYDNQLLIKEYQPIIDFINA